MCIYICMYIYIYLHTHIYTYVYIYTHIYIYTFIYIYITCIYTYMCVCVCSMIFMHDISPHACAVQVIFKAKAAGQWVTSFSRDWNEPQIIMDYCHGISVMVCR